MISLDDLVVATHIAAGIGCLKRGTAVGVGVVEPEGHVDALDLVDVVARLELARKEDLALVVFVKGGDGSLVIKLEGNDKVRLEVTRKGGCLHGLVATVGATRDGNGAVSHELGATRRANIAAVKRLSASTRRPLLRLGLGVGEHGLDLCNLELGIAMVTDELALAAVIAQRTPARWTLVVDALEPHTCLPAYKFDSLKRCHGHNAQSLSPRILTPRKTQSHTQKAPCEPRFGTTGPNTWPKSKSVRQKSLPRARIARQA